MDEQRVKEIVQSLTGLTFKEWQVIERQVNNEFTRLANQTKFLRSDVVTKNVLLEVSHE